jgi:RNA polymerase sigma factor (sigma-70 family)
MGIFRFWDMASQDDLLAEAQRNPGGAAMSELIKRFEPLVRKIAGSMTTCSATRDDLMSEARLALFLAVQRHTLGTPGFAVYAELTMRGSAMRWLRAWSSRSAGDLDGTKEPIAHEAVATNWGDSEVAEVVRSLPARQQQLLTLRYVEDAELSTIAQLRAVSESAISQQLRTVHRTLVLQLAA